MPLSKLAVCLSVVGAMLLGLAPDAHAEEVRIGGTGAALGTMQRMATAFKRVHPEHQVTVMPSMGSKGGIKAVQAGAIGLAVSARPLSEDERAKGLVSTVYGRTPLVFATQVDAPTDALSWQELTQAYAGERTQWPDGARIRLILRPQGDADSELIKATSPAMREAVGLAEQRKGMVFAVTDQEAADHIEKIPGAMGPLTLAQILSEKRPLKALKLSGVVPEASALADGRYPLQKELLFVTGPKPSAAVQAFMDFVRSPTGRTLLVQTGHWIP